MTKPEANKEKVSSLHSRLLIVIITPLLLVAALMTAWRYLDARQTTEHIYDNALLSIAHVITRDVVMNQGDLLADRLLQNLEQTSGDTFFYHIIGEQHPILLSGYTPPPKPSQAILAKANEDASRQAQYYDATFRGFPVRTVFFREYFSTSNYEGWVRTTVWQKTDQRQQLSLELAGRALSMLFLVLLATAGIVWLGVSYGLKPLLNLQAAIEKRSPENLSPIRRAVPREVSSLVKANNHLFAQVQRSIDEKDAFIANAAHQLRNPIAGLLSQAEAAERTTEAALLRQRVGDVAEAARRTARITQQLLSMERISQGSFAGQFHSFDLTKLVEETLTEFSTRALKQNTELSLIETKNTFEINGLPTLIREVLDNLLDNALRYACPVGGHIETRIDSDDKTVTVSINDDGPGIAEELLPHSIFERFTRGTEDGSGGCGLGLSIARSIVQAHGGTLKLVNSKSGGLEVQLTFPLSN